MLLAARDDVGMRVIHYDRNLGKGYAVKLGSLASIGEWVAIVDGDLDLHPSAIPYYLETARRETLDFAIGSKRHPDSIVHYPRSRRVASWMYQQLNRILFRLDVRDTQVGLKVFRGEVAEEVVPLLLVKQFAFDLELLAVGRALGYVRMREMPIRLDYRFTGSGVRSRAVVRALVDTLAIFYRLRVLRTYQRKRALFGAHGRVPESPPLVTLIDGESVAASLDYPRLEGAVGGDREAAARGARRAARTSRRGALPAGNWVTASVPYFADPDVAAVVAPTVSPQDTGFRECVAAAVLESRLGGGSRRSRFLPGNVGTVSDYPLDAVVVRRADYVDAREAGVDDGDLVAWLGGRAGGRSTRPTPRSRLRRRRSLRRTFGRRFVRRAPGDRPHVRRGARAQRRNGFFGCPARRRDRRDRAGPHRRRRQDRGLVVLAAYGIGLVLTAIFAAFRLRSIVWVS